MKLLASLFMSGMLCGSAFADLIVTEGTSGVQHFTNDGVFLGTLIAPGTGGLTEARGVAVSPGGDVFVADFANSDILRFNSAGGFLGTFTSGVNVDFPLGIAFGTGGDLFVASAGPVFNIARVNGTTGVVTNPNFTSGNALVLGGPQYLTFGPTLAVTDLAGHLFLFNTTTGVATSSRILDNPVGVAFDGSGDLFVAERISNDVLEFPSGGGPASVVIPHGAFSGSPTDLAFGPNGLLYVGTESNGIYRYDVSGGSGVLVDSFGAAGRYLAFTPNTPPVPEPAPWMLVGSGLLLAVVVRHHNS